MVACEKRRFSWAAFLVAKVCQKLVLRPLSAIVPLFGSFSPVSDVWIASFKRLSICYSMSLWVQPSLSPHY